MAIVESDCWWVYMTNSGEYGSFDTEAAAATYAEGLAVYSPTIVVPCKKYTLVED